ncbi:hypothetical protein BpHYR1_021972 [Brachionus plicatilis]|uniref:Uncharacterized protein n=1 Tax=Brachionus plicatilis TaxID=10195 RepID=A0A3M7PF29_BRAPC|nr:hypothetical protein BpHYR1_021972 [Brachionus plicatilis]
MFSKKMKTQLIKSVDLPFGRMFRYLFILCLNLTFYFQDSLNILFNKNYIIIYFVLCPATFLFCKANEVKSNLIDANFKCFIKFAPKILQMTIWALTRFAEIQISNRLIKLPKTNTTIEETSVPF